MVDLGARIRSARTGANLRQEDLADSLQVHVQTVHRWESGQSRPRADTIRQIADATGKPLSYFLGGAADDPAPSRPQDLAAEVRRLTDRVMSLQAPDAPPKHPGVEALLADRALCDTLGITDEDAAGLRRVSVGHELRIETVAEAIQALPLVRLVNQRRKA